MLKNIANCVLIPFSNIKKSIRANLKENLAQFFAALFLLNVTRSILKNL